MGQTCTGAPETELQRKCADNSEQQALSLHLNAWSQGCLNGERMVLLEIRERGEKASGGVSLVNMNTTSP